MKILMIRHGETLWNREHRFQGHTDIPLSDTGLLQASTAADALKTAKIDVIYASSLSRVLTTAKMIAQPHGLEPVVDNRLLELDFGEWDGHTHKELRQLYPEQYRAFISHPYSAQIPGEGSMKRGRIRAESFLEDVLSLYRGTDVTVALVGSSTVLKLCLFHLLDLSTFYFDNFVIDNATVSLLEEDGDIFRLKMLNVPPKQLML